MPTFNSFNNQPNETKVQQTIVQEKNTSTSFIVKVFGVMFLGLIGTALVTGLIGYIFMSLLNKATTEAEIIDISNALNILLIVSAIGLIIMAFVVPSVFARNKHNLIVPFAIYVILMGGLLSSFTLFVPLTTMIEAAGITALVFGVISLIGLIGKGRIPGLSLLIGGLFFGIIIISLINFIIHLTGVFVLTPLDWGISFLFFGLIMLISIWDVRNIKNIAERCPRGNNLTIYCAFMIYTDVISIFVRILSFLASSKRR